MSKYCKKSVAKNKCLALHSIMNFPRYGSLCNFFISNISLVNYQITLFAAVLVHFTIKALLNIKKISAYLTFLLIANKVTFLFQDNKETYMMLYKRQALQMMRYSFSKILHFGLDTAI